MTALWIVHREARWREALVRLAGDVEALAADPSDAAAFEGAPAPRAVLLAPAGDFEPELEFAHRFGPRLASAAWVILADARDAPELRRLFDALPADATAFASDAAALRLRLREALARRTAAAMSARRRRDALAQRFARWLGDLELPGLLAALDPARRELSLLVRGEPGTGRGLAARYVHSMGAGPAPGPFAAVAAWPEADLGTLAARLVPETGGLATPDCLTLCIEDVDLLAQPVQAQLRGWIEHGPPAGTLPATRLRWMATAGDPADPTAARLEPSLAEALSGIEVRLAPLRERAAAIERIAAEIASASGAALLAPDALEALREKAWPGNARELEAVLRRTLGAAPAAPIRAGDLAFGPPPPEDRLLETELIEEIADEPGALPLGRVTPAPAAAAAESPAAAPRASAPSEVDTALRRLAGAVAHEIANPLVGIRTFAHMLPSRFDDPEFRAQFAERVESDAQRIEAVVETLSRIGSLGAPERRPIDLCALLSRLLQLQRPRIQERRLVVLEELDRTHPEVIGDVEQLRFAFALLFDEALGWVPERGDLYLATRYEPARPDAEAPGARVRVLLRFRAGPGAEAPLAAGLAPADHALAVAAVEAVVRGHGGSVAVETAEPGETLVLIELPASPAGLSAHAGVRGT